MALIHRVRAFVRAHPCELAIAAAACAIAWAFAATTLAHAPEMGFPLDDSYIYLTYAKQFGRAQPFTYYPGGGYSAGSTSVLWPMLLAPFWTLGLRGHALVWVSYLWCTALYAATAIGVFRLARRLATTTALRDPDEERDGRGGRLAGLIAAGLTLAIPPFAFTALSGMEVAFASALLVAALNLLASAPRDAPPGRALALCLAAASLSRPEAMLLVGAIVGLCALDRARARRFRAAAWWLAPLAAPLAWLVANKLFAGQLFPNTGVAKSHFYLPGFDWTYWWSAVTTQTGKLIGALWWDGDGPLVAGRYLALPWLVGVGLAVVGAVRARRARLVALVVALAPWLVMLAVIASSGLWSVQNYRYITPAFPLLAIPIGLAAAPLARVVRRAWPAVAAVAVAGYAVASAGRLRADMRLFAQGAMDTSTQVVAIGRFVHAKLPDARVMFHDAGAIAYYGDGEVYDMLGLVTNFQAGVANNGPGARFEFLEGLAEDRRPTHFAYYPAWLGTDEFFVQPPLLQTPLLPGLDSRRLVGDGDMQVLAARWDHAHTGERPLDEHAGWAMVDRVDVADLASERAHGYRAELGRRGFGDPTARWSMVGRAVDAHGLVLDGGRTIRGGAERFAIARDPHKPVRLIVRGGGSAGYPYHDTITGPVALVATDADTGAVLARATLPPPRGPFAEVALELPAGPTTAIAIASERAAPYRVFHYFALQPE